MRWFWRLEKIMSDGKAVCKQCLGTACIRFFYNALLEVKHDLYFQCRPFFSELLDFLFGWFWLI